MGRPRITTTCSQVPAGLEADIDNIDNNYPYCSGRRRELTRGHAILFLLFEASILTGCIVHLCCVYGCVLGLFCCDNYYV